jgi:ribosome biogenesis GTPase / thiamine phosphate phosphatase
MQGLVLKSTGKWYSILLPSGEIISAGIKGKLRLDGLKTTNPVAAGDRVLLEKREFHYEDESSEFAICEVVPRENYIVRKSTNLSKQMQIIAANIDRMYLVVTLRSPVTQLAFVDRMLVSAESFRIPSSILFNKIDLYNSADLQQLERLKQLYEGIGYRCHAIRGDQETDVAFLRKEIDGKQVLFTGNSGVGKSTLVNSLDSSLLLRTGEISQAHEQGKHTTTFAEMHALKSGGYIIDTPGIRAFGLVDLEKAHYSHYFPEMRERMEGCKFHNCQHLNEPHCAIKKAVESGEIALTRYQTYVQLMMEDSDDPYRRNDYA